jgi:hypothetical protein
MAVASRARLPHVGKRSHLSGWHVSPRVEEQGLGGTRPLVRRTIVEVGCLYHAEVRPELSDAK